MENIPHGTWSSYSNHKCRCDLCRKAAREYQQQQRDKRRAADLETYNQKRAEESRSYRAKNPEKVKEYGKKSYRNALEKGAIAPGSVPHGTRSGYQSFGCRCEPCREAEWNYNQERKFRDLEKYLVESRERSRRWRERNPDRAKEIAQLTREKRKEQNWERMKAEQKVRNDAYRLRSKGVEIETEAELLASQNGVCAICGLPDKTKLSIDHCHTSGRIRGLLCRPCNLGLGCFKDDVERLKKAIEYLEDD